MHVHVHVLHMHVHVHVHRNEIIISQMSMTNLMIFIGAFKTVEEGYKPWITSGIAKLMRQIKEQIE